MTALLTALALVAFAANSILTRMALGAGAMDAATFTTVRIVAGAAVLATIVRVQGGPSPLRGGRSLVGPVALFAYAAPFSFAYVRIGAAAGALLLFGAVQITMIGWASRRGSGRACGVGGHRAGAGGAGVADAAGAGPARSGRQRAHDRGGLRVGRLFAARARARG